MRSFDDSISESKVLAMRQQEEENLIKQLAARNGYSYVNLQGVSISPAALVLIPEEEARTAEVVGFELTRKRLSVAVQNPNNPATQQTLQSLQNQGYEVTIFMTSSASLAHALKRYADRIDTSVTKKGVLDIDAANIEARAKNVRLPEDVAKAISTLTSVNNARRVSETIELIFAGALALRASDIHIEPEQGAVRLRYRLDGVLHDVIDLERSVYERTISRLKLLSGMILNIRDQAQDGRFTFTVFEKEIEVRSSIIPGAFGESIVMRLLDPTVASFNLEQLGLNSILHKVMLEELKRPNGLIITTGPTGSGKTTALYAFLRHAHTPEVKIITIENPVEYKVEGIVQTQVGDDYTFASGLRAVLRQDPDIIMVGEIRDSEVAETAIHAAQTGHLVFSTLHTNSAVGAFPRLIDLGVDYRMIGTSVNIMIGQRLVRVLCKECKKSRAASTEERSLITAILATHPAPPKLSEAVTLFEPVGCEACNHSGFKGRQGVFEAIKVDQAVEDAVVRDPREHIILEAARAQGIPTMAEDGIEKVLQGTTSLQELERVVDLTDGRHSLAQPLTKDESSLDDNFTAHIV